MTLEKRNEIELTITALAFGGDGLGREEEGEMKGRVVFVPGVLPGERVRVSLTQQKKDFARGHGVEWLKVSPERVEPPCPVVHQCGGCPWQHGSSTVQEQSKGEIVRKAIERLCGKFDAKPPEISHARAGEPFGYRSRIRVQVRKKKKFMTIGFHGKGSRDLVDIPACMVADKDVNRGLEILRKVIALDLEEGEGSAVISASGHGGVVVSLRLRRGNGDGLAHRLVEAGMDGVHVRWAEGEEEEGEPWVNWKNQEGDSPMLRIRAGGFAQGNPEVFRILLDDLIQAVKGMDPPPRRLLELFAGAGTLTLPLSASVEEIIAVDGDFGAVADLGENARRFGQDNICAREIDLHEPEMLAEIVDGKVDVIVLDPPREGARAVMDSIIQLDPRRIIYVSCDPITQVRDLGDLMAHGYRIGSVQVYDMFPQTPHMETLVVVDRKVD